MATPATDKARSKLLARQINLNREPLIDELLKARSRIEAKMLQAARNKKFSTSKSVRNGLYLDISDEYNTLQNNLDKWSANNIKRTSRTFHALAAKDVALAGKDAASFTIFSKQHLESYFERIHPFNATQLAAVNVQRNPQLGKMLDSDVRQLQTAVVDVFREARVTNMHPDARRKMLQATVMDIADNPKSWQFIDASGRTWKPNNYFAMLNRTVSASVARSTYIDAVTDEGFDLGRIIGGEMATSHPACAEWTGRVVSITGATRGYPKLDDYVAEGGFHPNCVHQVVALDPDFKPHAELIEEQKDLPAPKVPKPKSKRKEPVANEDKRIAKAIEKPTPEVPTTNFVPA